MNLIDATRRSLVKTFDYKTRSRRAEFWGFALSAFLICFFMGFFDKLFFDASWPFKQTLTLHEGEIVGRKYSFGTNYGPISNAFNFVFLLPFIAAAVRRLHDVVRSGWILILSYAVLFLTVFLFLRGFIPSSFFWFLFLGGIALFFYILFLLFKDSEGDNKYGPSEKYPHTVANPLID